jgi:hypothetical protein
VIQGGERGFSDYPLTPDGRENPDPIISLDLFNLFRESVLEAGLFSGPLVAQRA